MVIRCSSALSVLLIGLLNILTLGSAKAEEASEASRHSVVRLSLASAADVRRIAGLGIDLEGARFRDASGIELVLGEREIRKLRDAGFGVQVLVGDWRAAYAARQKSDHLASGATSRARNFHLGSMGGYLTIPEIEAVVDSMHLLYPQLIGTKDSIGSSCEGRTLWSVRITGNSTTPGGVPRVLYTALHHAREPEGMMSLIYFMWHVLEQYGVDEEITALLNTRELYVVPLVNPDGYAFNRLTDPSGGGMWRKNRRDNPDTSHGVDLNRNYGYQWGSDDYGSSATPDDDIYRGSAAFSEPETRAIRDLCLKLKPSCALNFHTYGDVVVHPWGYVNNPTDDSLVFRRLGRILTQDNYYTVGTCYTTVGYPTNGDSDDWMYGDTTGKPVIFAMTPEVGRGSDGFWPLPSRILPLADENLRACIRFAQCAGEHLAVVPEFVDPVVNGDDLDIAIRFTNIGLAASTAAAALQFTSNEVEVISSSRSTIALNDTTPVTLSVRRRTGIPDGTKATVQVVCTSPGGYSENVVSFRLGEPAVLFSDTARSGSPYWVAKSVGSLTTWAYSTRSAFSGAGSYADSPWGDYPPNYSSTFTLRDTLPFFGTGAELRFMARWDIEPEFDFCLLEASRDSGATWYSLPGYHTRPASAVSGSKQLSGSCGYDRQSEGWVEDRIDLGSLLGTHAMLRFRFASDSYVEHDGFFVDDLKILRYAAATTNVQESEVPDRMRLEQNYPNPFNPSTSIRYSVGVVSRGPLVATKVRLAVYDLLGREVAVLVDEMKQPGSYEVKWNAAGLSSGVYFSKLDAGGFSEVKKVVLMQ